VPSQPPAEVEVIAEEEAAKELAAEAPTGENGTATPETS
jgi:hypothetical protein